MKRALVWLGCVFVLSGLLVLGCQGLSNRGVEVVVEGDGEFPEFLVGRWKANGKSGWELVFEPDGTISSAVIALGRIKMTPGKVTRLPTRYGGKAVFEPGLWTVFYSPEHRELSVQVVIEHFYQDLGPHAIEGNNTDILVGPVSQDGKVWRAEWFMLGKYIALIPEPNEFSNVTEPLFRKSLIFEKVEQEE